MDNADNQNIEQGLEYYDNLTVDQIRDEIIKFKNDVDSQRLSNYYDTKSYGEILGVSRKETSHSNFIAWLLDAQQSHNLSSYPFRKFLEILAISSKNKPSQQHKALFDAVITDDLIVNNLSIVTEKSIDVGRIDIYIEANISYFEQQKNLRIIIENKVGSKENNNQTTRYYDYYEGLKDDSWINLYVFLTPISSIDLAELDEVECSCKAYIQTNYQHLTDYLLEPILNKNITSKTKNIIEEYLHALSQPTQNEEDETHKQGLIMAIGNEERQLLTKFWDKNQKLISSALYALSSDASQEKEFRDKIISALDEISNNQKDMRQYRFNDALYGKGRLVLAVLKRHVIDNPNITFAELERDFPKHTQGGYGVFCLKDKAIKIFEREGRKRKRHFIKDDEFIKIQGVVVAVCNQWGIDNINQFISQAKDLGYKISD